ncbi:hypothetical protein [Solihabitans fulvus]|uniref:hypothetical protein n=1 Tax=Solihabitans fulvus TaxID=1892852 RepID=UPI001CB75D63|nr:hypothetical protein [Solihabitans fulvus]
MVLFVFDGGTLNLARQQEIVLGSDEIASYEFVAPDALADRLPPRLARRVIGAVAAREAGRLRYLEHGVPLG